MSLFLVLLLTLPLYAKTSEVLSDKKDCGKCSLNQSVKVCVQIPPPGYNETQQLMKPMAYLMMPKCDYQRIVCEMGSHGSSIVPEKMCEDYYKLRRIASVIPVGVRGRTTPMPQNRRADQLKDNTTIKPEDIKKQ